MVILKEAWNKTLRSIGLRNLDRTVQEVEVCSNAYGKDPERVLDVYGRDDYLSDKVSHVRLIRVGNSKKGCISTFTLSLVKDDLTFENEDPLLNSLQVDFDLITCNVRHALTNDRYARKVIQNNDYLKNQALSERGTRVLQFDRLFLRHRDTGKWFLLSLSAEVCEETTCIFPYCYKEDFVPALFSGNLPEIGYKSLEEYYICRKVELDFLEVLEDVEDIEIAEERLRQDKERKEKEHQDKERESKAALTLVLANLLVDRNLAINNEVTKDDIVRLVKSGLLELEDIIIGRLSLQELVDEIVARIPEDQKEAFIERTKELVNVST